jgi:hypothetical protein
MNRLLRFLSFLRVVDGHDQTLSLTSIGLIVVLVKIALVPQPSLVDLGALLGTLLLYAHKRMSSAKTVDVNAELVATKEALLAATTKTEAVEKQLAEMKPRLVAVENRTGTASFRRT